MIVSEGRSNDASVTTFEPTMDLLGRLRRRFHREQIMHGFKRYQKAFLAVTRRSALTARSTGLVLSVTCPTVRSSTSIGLPISSAIKLFRHCATF